MKSSRGSLLIFIIIGVFVSIGSSLYSQKPKKNQKAEFVVLGNCEMCQNRIQEAALNVKGVKYVSWDIETDLFSTIYNAKKTSLLDIQKKIAEVGHDTPLVKATDSIYQSLPMCCLYERILE